jgi:hypothetical protein
MQASQNARFWKQFIDKLALHTRLGGILLIVARAFGHTGRARVSNHRNGDGAEWGSKGKDARLVAKFRQLFGHMEKEDLKLMLIVAQKMAKTKSV